MCFRLQPRWSTISTAGLKEPRVHLQGGVDGRVAGGTLGNAGAVVDDVLVAVGILAALLLSLASLM